MLDHDVDAPVRDRVFQPVVDRFHLDPIPTSWTLFRVHVFAMVTAYAGLCVLMSPAVASGGDVETLLVLAVPIFLNCLLFGRRLRRPPFVSMDLIGAVNRGCYVMLSAISLPLLVQSVFGTDDLAMRVCAFSFGVGLPAAMLSGYVHVCRKPPPRAPRTRTAGRPIPLKG